MMWLGEQITERGIGNGVSLLITVGIVSGMPSSMSQLLRMFSAPLGAEGPQFGFVHALLLVVLLLLVIAAMVAVTQVQRKISVQYAQRMVGRKLYSAQSSFLPLKVNYSGIMPVIFASAILVFPQQIFAYLGGASGIKFFQYLAYRLTQGSLFYYLVFGFLILAFSYFWVAMMFKPVQIADDIKKNGGYIPGVRPGEATAKFLDL
jgi:preprotein translocase subunit SecY